MEHGSTANATPGNQHSYTTNRPPPPPIPRRKPISSDEEKSPLLAPSVATHEAFVSGSSDGDQGFGVPSATSTAIHNQVQTRRVKNSKWQNIGKLRCNYCKRYANN